MERYERGRQRSKLTEFSRDCSDTYGKKYSNQSLLNFTPFVRETIDLI